MTEVILNDAQREQALALRATGVHLREIATEFGVNESTLRRFLSPEWIASRKNKLAPTARHSASMGFTPRSTRRVQRVIAEPAVINGAARLFAKGKIDRAELMMRVRGG